MPQTMNNTITTNSIHQIRVSIARILRLEQQTHTRLNQVRKATHTNESE